MNHTADNKRIAKNTLMLYIRSFIVMVVSLYTSRVVLDALGFADYGIYVLIGSFVATFSMFSATFTSATQRFLNFELGRGDTVRAKKVFSASLHIFVVIAIAIAVLLETVGLWYLNTKMIIPDERMVAANIVYQLSILTFVINLICLPFNATIIANEKMGVFAYVSIYEALAKLGIVFLLSLSPIDELIFYCTLLLILSMSVLTFYIFYCKTRFEECSMIRVKDKKLYKEILSFSGWNFLGSGATVLTTSGMSVVINYYTNVIVNSANGLSSKISSTIQMLLNNFMVALRPQIVKAYANNEHEYMFSLVSRGSRLSYALTWILCIPVIIIADVILGIWLKEVPPYTTEFVRTSLMVLIFFPFSTILDMVIIATGKIKNTQITLSLLQLANLPISCAILYFGMPPYFVYYSFITISVVSLVYRIKFAIELTGMSLKRYCQEVLIPAGVSFILAMLILVPTVIFIYKNTVMSALTTVVLTLIVLLFFSWIFLLNKNERKAMFHILKEKINIHNRH